MRIEYRVLWFEDKPSFFSWNKQYIKKLYEYLDNLWFSINIQVYHKTNEWPGERLLSSLDYISLKKVNNYLKPQLNALKNEIKKADIILVDYELGWIWQDGNNVIEFIRDDMHDIYTEVLFYTSKYFSPSINKEDWLRNAINRDWLYCADRDDVLKWKEKLKKIINVALKKNRDLNNLRGLVMAETSELDFLMWEIIALLHNSKLLTKTKIKNTIKDSVKFHTNILSKLTKIWDDFWKFIDEGFTKSSYVKCSSISRFSQLKDVPIEHSDIKNYHLEVNKPRNDLAHYPELIESDKIIVNGEEYNETRFIELRKKIKSYKKKLLEIKSTLS